MQGQTQTGFAASEETILAFKRHILLQSGGFEAEPMADAFRVNLLSQMLNRYDALRGKGLSDMMSRNRVMDEFDDIAAQMRAQGFTPVREGEHAANTRWPLMSEAEVDQYIRERDAHLHKTALGTALCTACATPLMLGAALTELWGLDVYVLSSMVGMFAMIGLGVATMVMAEKPKKEEAVRKGKFSLSARVRRRLMQMREDVEGKARKRKGRGIFLLVTCAAPVLLGSIPSSLWGSDFWAVLGVGLMFPMIGAGVYQLMMAKGEKRTMDRLLCEPEDE